MADAPPTRRGPGRPRLRDGEDSLSFSLRVPVSTYDQAHAIATRHGVTVPEVFRQAFALVTKHRIEPDDDERDE